MIKARVMLLIMMIVMIETLPNGVISNSLDHFGCNPRPRCELVRCRNPQNCEHGLVTPRCQCCPVCLKQDEVGGDVMRESDYDVIMRRLHESALESVSRQSLKSLSRFLNEDGSFSDLSYGRDDSTSFRIHGRRQGALAYHNLQGMNTTQQVISCFTYITNHAPNNTDRNWWGHLIGTPTLIWEGAVLARDILPPQLLSDFLQRFWVTYYQGPVWNPSQHTPRFAGGNFAPRAFLGEVEGLLRGPNFFLARHAEVKRELTRELVLREPWGNDGLRPDGCLHQHSIKANYRTQNGYLDHSLGLIYNGSYGKEMLSYLARLFTWFTGTSEDFDSKTIDGLLDAYLECNQWLFRGHTFEPTSTGRFIASGKRVTRNAARDSVSNAGKHLLKLGHRTSEVEAALHRYHNVVPHQKYLLEGNKHFFNSDLTMHHRRNYMASVRVLSNRTVRQETWRSANPDGFFQGDGFLTVLVDAGEYGEPTREVFQVYDWARIPGVTNLYTQNIPQYKLSPYWSENFFNNAVFVGGVTDEMVGVTAMDFNRPHVPLTALKSYFFFDDVLVVVGSRITLSEPTGEHVITTLAQITYGGQYAVGDTDGVEITAGPNPYLTISSPTYLHHRNIGYVFLRSHHTLHIKASMKTLNSEQLGVFTSWISHGSNPQDEAFAYAILPDADVNRTKNFYINPEVEMVAVLPDTHVVCHKPSKTVAAVISTTTSISVPSCGESGAIDFKVTVPCLAVITVVSETAIEARVKVSLSDPQQTHSMVFVKLGYRGRVAFRWINFPPEPKRGSSISVTFII